MFLDKVVDAPVTMLHKFQQSFEFLVPQTQFIFRLLVFQLCRRDRYPKCSPSRRLFTCPLLCSDRIRCCSSSQVVDIPVVIQRLIPMVETVQMITQIPQLHYFSRWSMSLLRSLTSKLWWFRSCCSSKVVFIPVVTQWLIFMVQTVQKTPEIPQAHVRTLETQCLGHRSRCPCPRCRRQFFRDYAWLVL